MNVKNRIIYKRCEITGHMKSELEDDRKGNERKYIKQSQAPHNIRKINKRIESVKINRRLKQL